MRISDWSSDVCSSDLDWKIYVAANMLYVTSEQKKVDEVFDNDYQYRVEHPVDATFGLEAIGLFQDQTDIDNSPIQSFGRSEERSVGKEWVSTCRSRWSPYHEKKNINKLYIKDT